MFEASGLPLSMQKKHKIAISQVADQVFKNYVTLPRIDFIAMEADKGRKVYTASFLRFMAGFEDACYHSNQFTDMVRDATEHYRYKVQNNVLGENKFDKSRALDVLQEMKKDASTHNTKWDHYDKACTRFLRDYFMQHFTRLFAEKYPNKIKKITHDQKEDDVDVDV
jgi:hypothetical protein